MPVVQDLLEGQSFSDTPLPPEPPKTKPLTPEEIAAEDAKMRAALQAKGIPAPPPAPGTPAAAPKPADPFAGETQLDPFHGETPATDAFSSERQADALDERDPSDLAKDPNFKIHDFIFANKNNIFNDPKRYQKALDTYREAQAQGSTFKKTVESVKKDTLPLLSDLIKSVPARLANISDIAVAPLVDAVTEKIRGERLDPEKHAQWENMTQDAKEAAIAEAVAGTQTAVGSLQDMVRQGARKLVGPAFEAGGKKDWRKISDDELKNELFKDLGWRETVEGLASGEGVKDLVSEGVQLNPENIKLLSLTDPITLVGTGVGLKAVSLGGKVLFTAANQAGADAALSYLGRAAGTAAAKTAQLVGRGVEATGQGIKAAIPMSGHGAGVAASLHLLGVPGKALAAVRMAAPVIEQSGKLLREIGEAGGAVPKGQLSLGLDSTAGAKVLNAAKSAAEFVQPPVVGALEGAAATAPLAFATDEPQGGLLGVGAVGGTVHGAVSGIKGAVAERGAKRYFDPGQITWEKKASPGYEGFDELNKAHEAVAASTPENARNMVDSLRETLRPFGKKLFLVDDAAYAKAIEQDTIRQNGGKPLTPEQQAAVAQEARSRGVSKINVTDANGDVENVTLVKSSADAPHEFSHVLESVMAPEAREALHDAVRAAYTPAELDALKAHYEQQMGRPFTPEEVRSEFIADNWANLLYNTPFESLGLPQPKAGFRAGLLDAALGLGNALGIDMTAGRKTPGLGLKPSYSLRTALTDASEKIIGERDQLAAQQATAPEVKPAEAPTPAAPVEVPVEPPAQGELPLFEQPSVQPNATPEATPPAPPVAPVKPAAAPSAQRAEVTNSHIADTWAAGKENAPAVAEVNAALNDNVGLRVEHAGAPKVTYKPTEPERAAEVEEGRGLPPEAREQHAKELRPTRWEQTKSGEPQLIARSTDKVMSNIDRAVQWAKAAGEKLPWAVDERGALTMGGLKTLLGDLDIYWDNQDRGFRGGGEKLVRPAEDLGVSLPAEQGEGVVLGPEKEQWLNLLQGKDIGPPETARAQKGKLPANIKAQELRAAQGDVSERIAPGTDIPIYPEKVTQGRGPVEIMETNPLRNRLRAAGLPVGELHTVVERLNAADITKAERAPELRGKGGSTDIARAGYLTDQPVDKTISDVLADSPDDWNKRFGPKNTLTKSAYELGLGLKSKDELNALRNAQAKAAADQLAMMDAVRAGDMDKMDEAYALATKAQFFREAAEAATDTASAAGPSGWRRSFPDRSAPFAEVAPEAKAGFLTEKELEPIRNGDKEGETFNADGSVFVPPAGKKLDVVTLASVNLPLDGLNEKSVADALAPYKEALGKGNIKAGVFKLSAKDAEGRPQVSVDVNAVVDQKHRESSLAFAKANNQEAIFDLDKLETISTGGTGDTVLKSPAEIAKAADALQRGENFLVPGEGDVMPAREGYLPEKRAPKRESEKEAEKRVAATDYSKYAVKSEQKPEGGKPTGWVLPDGQFVRLDTDYHQSWLGEHSEQLNKQFGTEFPKDATIDDRQAALNKGFIRAREYNGKLAIEANQKFFKGRGKRAIEALLADHADSLDHVQVHLLDDNGQLVDQAAARLFDAEDPRSAALDVLDRLNPDRTTSKRGPSAIQIARSREGYLAEPKEGQEIVDTLKEIAPNGDFKLVGSVAKGKVGAKDMDFAVSFGTKHVESEMGHFLHSVKPELEKLGWEIYDDSVSDYGGEPEGQWIVPAKTPKGDVAEFFFEGSTDDAPPNSYPGQREEARGGYLPGEKLTPKTAEVAATKHNDEYTKSYPEALPTRFIRDSKGKLKLQGGKLVPGYEEAALDKTPLAQDAVRENPDVPAHEAIAEALSDKIVAEAHEALKDESMKAGLTWYDDAVKLIKKFFGEDGGEMFAQLLAATSPQNGVQPNFAYAIDAWNAVKRGEYEPFVKKYLEGREQWKTGGTPEIAEWEEAKGKKWKAGTGDAALALRNNFLTWWVDKHEILPKREGGKLYGMHSFPVLDVISGTWLEDVGGPKVRNFLANLTGKGHEATIDIWATRFLMRIAQSEDTIKGRWRVAPPAGWQISAPNFDLAQLAFRKAAEKMNVKPDALQALVWFSEKHLWEEKDWTGYVGAAKSDYAYWLKALEPGKQPATYEIPVRAKEEATRQGREERAKAAAKRAGQGELDIPVNPVED